MKKKVIIIASFIIVLLSSLIILYNKIPRYNMEVDGVKLAVTLDGDEVSSFPKNDDYYVDINCRNAIGECLYDETEQTFKLTFKNIESGAKCNLAFTTNPDTLIDIVEDTGYLEDNIPTGYNKIGQSGYMGSAPTSTFYTTSFSASTTSGTTDPDATLTFDTTNNMWVTSNQTSGRYYYFFFNMASAGTYQFCTNKTSGATSYVYIYSGTTNLLNESYFQSIKPEDNCVGVGNLNTSSVIKVVTYTQGTNVTVPTISFGFKKAAATTNAGYRYEGRYPNNYIWFNNELWRIIGSVPTKIDSGNSTTTTNLVKIIREDSIGALVWHTTTTRPEWGDASLKTLLNDYYYGALNATGNTYCNGMQSTKSKCDYRYMGINPYDYYGSMIEEVYWNTGYSNTNISYPLIYADEIETQTVKAKVGIMSLSDFGLASNYNKPNGSTSGNMESNDWANGRGLIEWTLTCSPRRSGGCYTVYASGEVNDINIYVYYGFSVRPVVYLDPSLYVVSGDGSQATPYKIAWPSSS